MFFVLLFSLATIGVCVFCAVTSVAALFIFSNRKEEQKMKKMLAILLVSCLCIGLSACGGKKTQTAHAKDWDPIAEATATLNQFLACETEEDFRAVYHSSYSDSDIKTLVEYQNEDRASWDEDISKKFVRKIKKIDTYKDGDVFFYAEGYETKDGYRTPVNPLPESKVIFTAEMLSHSYSIIVLTIENGRYVLANVPTDEWQEYIKDLSFCTCDLGTVLIPGDPCKSCGGAGYLAEESNDDSKDELSIPNDNFVYTACLTCNGDGVLDDETICNDCLGAGESILVGAGESIPVGGMLNMAEQDPCSDCDGTGLENYTYGDCPDCSGQGYKKIG